MTSLSLNERIDDGIFELNFPPGTRVFDEIQGMNYTVGARVAESQLDDWIDDVMRDAEEGLDVDSEISTPLPSQEADTSVATPGPPSPAQADTGSERPQMYMLALFGIGSLIVVSGFALLVRKHRRLRN